MGIYLKSEETYLSTSTDRSLTVLKLIDPWRAGAWKEEDDAAEARDREAFEAASNEEKKTWYFGYSHPSHNRDPQLINIGAFKKASAELPATLNLFIRWAKANLSGEVLYNLGVVIGKGEITATSYMDALLVINKAVELDNHVHIS